MLRPMHLAQGFAGMVGLAVIMATSAFAQGTTFTKIQRGRYLSKAGDCIACHTAKGGKSYAGGFPVPTPFGTIYSTNITPDLQTGIGSWSNDDFYNAMHFGIRRDGQNLYPAFPYPWYTKLSRADVDAIKAYLDTLEPVQQENKPSELPWPLSLRVAVDGWKMLFFRPGKYVPNPKKSDAWNRGAYLVEGAAHCAACHTAKNMFGATQNDKDLMGGDAGESWFAPSLSRDHRDGIGEWSTQEIVEYLKTGANSKSASAGPMTDVVMNSTQYLSDNDLNAMAAYLQDLPQDTTRNTTDNSPQKNPADDRPDQSSFDRGRSLYVDNCMGCHMAGGEGQAHSFPPLKGSSAIQAEKADSLVQVILAGAKMADPPAKPTGLAMPAYAWKLSDADVADLVNYIRNAWGNHASPVDAGNIADVRKDVEKTGAGHQGALATAY